MGLGVLAWRGIKCLTGMSAGGESLIGPTDCGGAYEKMKDSSRDRNNLTLGILAGSDATKMSRGKRRLYIHPSSCTYSQITC